MKKMDVKNSEEFLDAMTGTIEDLANHRADDGKISAMEWGQTAMANAPAWVKAIADADLIDDEIKDMDAEEAQLLAKKGLRLAKAVWALAMSSKPEGK